MMTIYLLAIACVLCGAQQPPATQSPSTAESASQPQAGLALPSESDYYPITSFEIPEGVVLEAGAVQLMPDGRLAVATRRGEIWMVDQPLAKTVSASQFKLFAEGLHEPLGLTEKDGWLYVTQRPDVSRIRDTDQDGLADEFEVVADGWGISGDYHEYAFGSKFDSQGNIWVVLCLTGSFTSEVPYRGWCVRVTANGETIPTCSGIRSPGGIGANLDGELFYTDNQGPWNGTCHLKHLIPGKFMGNPEGFRWFDRASSVMGKQPLTPESPSRSLTQAARIPEFEVPAVMFPYDKMGKSASGVSCDVSGGKFGPFAGQMFVSDQSASTVMRVYLEKVQGHYQGVCFPFRSGLASGNVATEILPQGCMLVGGTNRGWGSVGPQPFSLERIDWSGKVPFEILEMHALRDGFELTFTQPVDPAIAANLAAYDLSTYTYIYQSAYGSPEVDPTRPKIKAAQVAENGLSVRLSITGLQRGHVHELHCDLKNTEGLPLLHQTAYYTLNYLPE